LIAAAIAGTIPYWKLFGGVRVDEPPSTSRNGTFIFDCRLPGDYNVAWWTAFEFASVGNALSAAWHIIDQESLLEVFCRRQPAGDSDHGGSDTFCRR
jgi:hypothetical protein